MKRYGVHGIVTRSQNLGAAIRRMKEVADGTPEEEFFRFTGGTFASFPALVAAAPWLNIPFFVGPVNGIVVSLVLYIVLDKLMPAPAPAEA